MPTPLQSGYNAVGSGNGTVTCGSNVSSGTKLLVAVVINGGDNADDITSVKDAANNAMTLVKSAVDPGFNGQVSLFAFDTPAGDVGTKPTFTATVTGSNFGVGMFCQEVPGLASGNTLAAMIDGTAAIANGANTGPATTGAYSSTAAGEYLVAVAGAMFSTVTIGDSSGYTGDANDNPTTGPQLVFNYRDSSNGSESASFAITGGTAQWDTILVAFKLAAAGGAPAPGSAAPRFAPGWHPGSGLPGSPGGTPFLAVLPPSVPPGVTTAIAAASLAGAGTVTALAVTAAGASSAGAGTLAALVTQAVPAAAAGAGSVTAAVTQSAPATAAGTASLAALVTGIAPASLSGSGAVSALATVIVPAALAGAGAVSGLAAQSAPAVLTGAGAASALVTERVIASAAGAGLVSATVAGAGGAASLPGSGSLSAAAGQCAPVSPAGAGSLSAKAAVIAGASLAGSGSLLALAVQRGTAGLAAAGTVTATGVAVAPFTPGTLTAGDAPTGVLTAAGAPSGTLTSATQATGGPS